MILFEEATYKHLTPDVVKAIIPLINNLISYELTENSHLIQDDEARNLLEKQMSNYNQWKVDDSVNIEIADLNPIQFSKWFKTLQLEERTKAIKEVKQLYDKLESLEDVLQYSDRENLYKVLIETCKREGVNADCILRNKECILESIQYNSRISKLKRNQYNIKAIFYGLKSKKFL